MLSVLLAFACLLIGERTLEGFEWMTSADELYGWGEQFTFAVLLVVVGIYLPFWLLDASLVSFHVYLWFEEMTTYEYFKGRRPGRKRSTQTMKLKFTTPFDECDNDLSPQSNEPAARVEVDAGLIGRRHEIASVGDRPTPSAIEDTDREKANHVTLSLEMHSVGVGSNTALPSKQVEVEGWKDVELVADENDSPRLVGQRRLDGVVFDDSPHRGIGETRWANASSPPRRTVDRFPGQFVKLLMRFLCSWASCATFPTAPARKGNS